MMPGFAAERALGETATEAGRCAPAPALAAAAPATIQPFCHRGWPNCMSDCLARCEDAGGYCEHNCGCCCSGHTAGCYM
jgi:hypothetical protein